MLFDFYRFRFMKKKYVIFFLAAMLAAGAILSCSDSEEDSYVPVEISPVSVDLTQVPYPKLSDYKFFKGIMKNLEPALNVIPFEPASALFTDYALKKRFVWMPVGTKATYNGDNKILQLPVGAALIKNFYYDNVQNITNAGRTRIIETRIMIRKSTGWIFAEYVWNEDQTEAYYDMVGSFTPITWKDEHDISRSTIYRIPSQAQCITCHKSQVLVNNELKTTHIPIGIKPQNLNFSYNYGSQSKNQLIQWMEQGYLTNNFSLPTDENTVINYKDNTKSLELRVRSYVDANCSHCHMDERHCDYRPMRFAFSETGSSNGSRNMGVCVNTSDMQGFPAELDKVVSPGSPEQSMMYYRLNTINETYRMPLHGRTLIHEEGIALIRDWINSLPRCE